MFEARFQQGKLFKGIAEAIKDLVQDCNWECSADGITMQAMDSGHVCLVFLKLDADGFEPFRCDRNRVLGMSIPQLTKVLKLAGNDDMITLSSQDDSDTLTLVFESPAQDRICDFQFKLMEVDVEQLGIPENDYSAQVKMSSSEFARLVKDLSSIGDAVSISVSKDGVKFSTSGDIGTANVTLRHSPGVGGGGGEGGSKKKGLQEQAHTVIDMVEPVALNFSIRYLVSFSKAASLSTSVLMTLTKDLPLMVEFRLEDLGYLRCYLAPKVDDEEDQGAGAGEGMDD